MKLGAENRKTMAWALGLGAVAVIAIVYQVIPLFSGPSVTPVSASAPSVTAAPRTVPGPRGKGALKKARGESLDPTLHLHLLALSEDTKYTGSGRNIFVSQAEEIQRPLASGVTDPKKIAAEAQHIYEGPRIPPAPPIPLKFFGFASRPGEPKKIFLSKDQDVFIAGEGEIVDRRYKVVRITPTSVDIQDLVSSGPAQTIQLTQS
jgi:hypothetical protein